MMTIPAHPTPTPQPWTPVRAWMKSLPLALSAPCVIWFLGLGFMALSTENSTIGALKLIGAFGAFCIISAAVHLVAYAIVGIPIFFWGANPKHHCLWRMPNALVTGLVAGVVPTLIVLTLTDGVGMKTLIETATLAVYGILTGVAAWFQRPQREAP